MREFVLSIPDGIKQAGEKLNLKASLCDKPWIVYNDEDAKVVFIFNADGDLLVSTNGRVEFAKWQYVKANGCVLITLNGNTTMYRVGFADKLLMALQVDGTSEYLLLINENEEGKLLSTLDKILDYISKPKVISEPKVHHTSQNNSNETEIDSYCWINDIRV